MATPKFNTNKCILKIRWICGNPHCESNEANLKEPQTGSTFSVKIVRSHKRAPNQQVADMECIHCNEITRCELN
jgi:hypothetical protein